MMDEWMLETVMLLNTIGAIIAALCLSLVAVVKLEHRSIPVIVIVNASLGISIALLWLVPSLVTVWIVAGCIGSFTVAFGVYLHRSEAVMS